LPIRGGTSFPSVVPADRPEAISSAWQVSEVFSPEVKTGGELFSEIEADRPGSTGGQWTNGPRASLYWMMWLEQLLLFQVAGRRFALPLAAVREVVRAVAVSPLPGSPPIVEGIVDVHGMAAAVLDLGARLGTERGEVSPSDFMIVASAGERLVVLRVNEVAGIVELPADSIEAVGAVTSRAPEGFPISGVAHLPDGLALIHDVGSFLQAAEATELEEALASRGGALA